MGGVRAAYPLRCNQVKRIGYEGLVGVWRRISFTITSLIPKKEMANSSLSPRQKMINMMYLVLLAILVLNVSTEVLDAFTHLRSKLKATAEDAQSSSGDFILHMKAEIDREIENQGKHENEGLKDTLDQIQARTRGMMKLIQRHVLAMENIGEYDPEIGDYVRREEMEDNYQYWMGTDEEANQRRGNGEAQALRDSLDSYSTFLTALYNGQVKLDSLQKRPVLQEDPKGGEDPDKRWEQATFEGPVVANMATLEAMKVDIYREEKDLLDLLNTRLGVDIFVPDTVMPISAPNSKVVVAGTPFQTRLFVGMAAKGVYPEFSSRNGRIQAEGDGNSAMLTIGANGGVISNGEFTGVQRYEATIRVPKATGGFEELVLRDEFTVVKPTVSMYSAALQQMYRNCGNAINIDVPALGALYRPLISASNANVRQSPQNRKKFLIIPRGRQTEVTVQSETEGSPLLIDKIKYQVVDPPKPSVELFVNNRPMSVTTSVPKNSRFAIRIVPDATFKRLMPRDARYGVQSVEILLKDGLQPARTVKTINMQGKDATQLQALSMPMQVLKAPRTAKMFIRLNGIYRLNFQGNREEDPRFSEWDRTFPVDLR